MHCLVVSLNWWVTKVTKLKKKPKYFPALLLMRALFIFELKCFS